MSNLFSDRLTQKLFLYGVSAGAAAVATDAGATIQYSGPISLTSSDIYFTPTTETYGTGSFESGGEFKLITGYTTTTTEAHAIGGATKAAYIANGTTNTEFALELQSGATIGGSTSFGNGSTSTYFDEGTLSGTTVTPGNGYWHAGDTGFIGLKFEVGTQTDYGWAEVTFNGLPTSANPSSSFTLDGFAYQDSGAAIPAGAIPEPTTTAAMLVAGAAGVAAWRRRREAQSEQE